MFEIHLWKGHLYLSSAEASIFIKSGWLDRSSQWEVRAYNGLPALLFSSWQSLLAMDTVRLELAAHCVSSGEHFGIFAYMSLSKSATSLDCSLSACRALIAAKDSQKFCVVCLGLRHAEEALKNPKYCSYCFLLPIKLLWCCHKFATAQCVMLNLSDSLSKF